MRQVKKCLEIMRKKLVDVLKSMTKDMNCLKSSLDQTETKLETAKETKLVDSVGKEVMNCVKDLKDEVVGISNTANNNNIIIIIITYVKIRVTFHKLNCCRGTVNEIRRRIYIMII